MAEADPSSKDANTSTFPALTTTFTPPPECTSWYIDECTDTTDCFVQAFPTGTGICGSNGSDRKTSYACYPKVSRSTMEFANGQGIYTLEIATYSPGLYCPLGMSTATSVPLLDGVFCCPSGMRFQGGLQGGTCARTQTEGTFILSSDCTRTTIPKPTGSITTTISMYAMPVFLGGQKLLNPSSASPSSRTKSSSTSTTTTSSTPQFSGNNDSSSIGLKVGLGLGIPLGVILLLALCGFWYVRRYRRKMARKIDITSSDISEEDKPELAGATFQPSFVKAELDPLATRAELEAPAVENGGGIFVQKPELQGTDILTKPIDSVVYVKRKAELEGVTNHARGSAVTQISGNV
ncbi:hypothetical protein CIB48_g8348 [Xylaria polymorpha]|nr:hypothetical protein CIB48_g8348 [Xylaria polymorpha]